MTIRSPQMVCGCGIMTGHLDPWRNAFREGLRTETAGRISNPRLGSLLGKRVLVTGCGPIGALTIMAARLHGAREIVATDIAAAVLEKAGRLGADRTINVAENP